VATWCQPDAGSPLIEVFATIRKARVRWRSGWLPGLAAFTDGPLRRAVAFGEILLLDAKLLPRSGRVGAEACNALLADASEPVVA